MTSFGRSVTRSVRHHRCRCPFLSRCFSPAIDQAPEVLQPVRLLRHSGGLCLKPLTGAAWCSVNFWVINRQPVAVTEISQGADGLSPGREWNVRVTRVVMPLGGKTTGHQCGYIRGLEILIHTFQNQLVTSASAIRSSKSCHRHMQRADR